MPARIAPLGPLLLVLGAAWIAGCAAPKSSVQSEWKDKASHSQSFKRVLVVGVSPELGQRCPFERFLAAQIQNESVTAIASCDAVTRKEPLTRESIDQAVAATQSDAVVATLLVAMSMAAKEGGERETRGSGLYKATDIGFASDYYGLYGVPVVYGEFQAAPAITTIQGEVHIATRVYETRGPTMVYEVTTKARDLQTREGALAWITGLIADRLRRDGLVP